MGGAAVLGGHERNRQRGGFSGGEEQDLGGAVQQ